MPWEVNRTDEVLAWITTLDEESKIAILKSILILSDIGPELGRPHVDVLKGSKHKNMKELRVQNKKKVFRILFAFDPIRRAILLIGGDKKGDDNFYKKFIPKADSLYDQYLIKLEEEINNERKKKR